MPPWIKQGAHKSLHCSFCKDPGRPRSVEKLNRSLLETKTTLHLGHQAADIKVFQITDQPGVPAADSAVCICQLEGKNCKKCAPDPKYKPPIRKECDCKAGAKPDLEFYAVPKQKHKKVQVNWFEVVEKRRTLLNSEKILIAAAKRKAWNAEKKAKAKEGLKAVARLMRPQWFHPLSCPQIMYLESLALAIRLDLDECVTDRTFFILAGIGLFPRPKQKYLRKCMRDCDYNSIKFLNCLLHESQEIDKFHERNLDDITLNPYSWNDRLIMNCLCHLEFPMVLQELIDRIPELPRDKLLPLLPYPEFPKRKKLRKGNSPYLDPVWVGDKFNWNDQQVWEQINRARAHMDTRRVKIPTLALVRRPSLLDARPPYMAQIEALERAFERKPEPEKKKKPGRKREVQIFDSKIDLTAVADIMPSESSSDQESVCIFLREPPTPEIVEDAEEAISLVELLPPSPEIQGELMGEDYDLEVDQPLDEPTMIEDIGEWVGEMEEEGRVESELVHFIDDLRKPAMTESGTTIAEPCLAPKSSPAPPAPHWMEGHRYLGVLGQEVCAFDDFIPYDDDEKHGEYTGPDVDKAMKDAKKKLKILFKKQEAEKPPPCRSRSKKKKKGKSKASSREQSGDTESPEGGEKRKLSKSSKASKASKKSKSKTRSKSKKSKRSKSKRKKDKKKLKLCPRKKKVKVEREEVEEEEVVKENENLATLLAELMAQTGAVEPPLMADEEMDDEWGGGEEEWLGEELGIVALKKEKKKKRKRKGKKKEKKKKKVKEVAEFKVEEWEGEGEMEIPLPLPPAIVTKEDKVTMTECYPGEYDYLYAKELEPEIPFRGDVDALLLEILCDLADEGYITPTFCQVEIHPDIVQLIQYLRGEIITEKKRAELMEKSAFVWELLVGAKQYRLATPELTISKQKLKNMDYNDRKWVLKYVNKISDEFYFKIAKKRANVAKDLYGTTYPTYFRTEGFHKAYFSYLIPKYEESIIKGIVDNG